MWPLPGEVDVYGAGRVRAERDLGGGAWVTVPQREHLFGGGHGHTQEIQETYRMRDGVLGGCEGKPVAHWGQRTRQTLGSDGVESVGCGGDGLVMASGRDLKRGRADVA